ncbi:MAG: motility associated factor glycosyltransferase family protein [Proteobacteria bacterium]|nr:motility associated factor glycosyltransferase family protein [Pseudomonadota bacterium]
MLIPFDPTARAAVRRFKANRAALTASAQSSLAAIDQGQVPLPNLLADSTAPDVVVNLQTIAGTFYAGDARQLAHSQVEHFVGLNQSFLPGVVKHVPEDEIAYERSRALDDAFGEPLMAVPRAYTVSPSYAPVLTVFGIGLGWHIDELVHRFEVLHLILGETEPALFHASLYAIDWTNIVRRFGGPGRRLTLSVDGDAAAVTRAFQAALDVPSRALAVGSRFFRHYQSPAMDRVAEAISPLVPFLGFGWGYFKDERRQVLHTRANIRGPYQWLRRRWPPLAEADAVVVGGGPSLELTLPLLKRMRENVVVFSGGSAIRPLIRAGIEPDFHVELETSPTTTDILGELGAGDLFARVALLASNGMVPSALTVFKRTHLFVRDNSLSSGLLGDSAETIPGCYPVVGNAAVGIAAALGFRRITLFGVDFGYRDPRRHHAAGTIYMDDASGHARQDLKELGLGHVEMWDYSDTRHRLVSTRGDELRADDLLRVSHLMMESFLANTPGLRLRQCGEGARISGANNIVPEELDPSAYRVDRGAMLEAVARRFESAPVDEPEYVRRMAALADDFDHLARRLTRLFRRPSPSIAVYVRLLSEAWEILKAVRAPALEYLLTGIFTSYFKATIERSFMTSTEADRKRFIGLAQTHFIALLRDVAAALEPMRAAPPTAQASPRHIAS